MLHYYYQYQGDNLADKMETILKKLPCKKPFYRTNAKFNEDAIFINISGEHYEDILDGAITYFITFDIFDNNIDIYLAISGGHKSNPHTPHTNEVYLSKLMDQVLISEGFTTL